MRNSQAATRVVRRNEVYVDATSSPAADALDLQESYLVV
jgi:hypothetical protein